MYTSRMLEFFLEASKMQKEKENIRKHKAFEDLLEIGYSTEEALEIIKGKAKKSISLDQEIFNLLLEIGIPTNLMGFDYIVEAIKMMMNSKKMAMTKEVYPLIAKQFNTTPAKVERCIRTGIEVAFDDSNLETLQYYFKNSYSAEKGRPTNSQFLTLVAHIMQLKEE